MMTSVGYYQAVWHMATRRDVIVVHGALAVILFGRSLLRQWSPLMRYDVIIVRSPATGYHAATLFGDGENGGDYRTVIVKSVGDATKNSTIGVMSGWC